MNISEKLLEKLCEITKMAILCDASLTVFVLNMWKALGDKEERIKKEKSNVETILSFFLSRKHELEIDRVQSIFSILLSSVNSLDLIKNCVMKLLQEAKNEKAFHLLLSFFRIKPKLLAALDWETKSKILSIAIEKKNVEVLKTVLLFWFDNADCIMKEVDYSSLLSMLILEIIKERNRNEIRAFVAVLCNPASENLHFCIKLIEGYYKKIVKEGKKEEEEREKEEIVSVEALTALVLLNSQGKETVLNLIKSLIKMLCVYIEVVSSYKVASLLCGKGKKERKRQRIMLL